MHRRRLTLKLDEDEAEVEQEIEIVTNEATRLFSSVQRKLKQITAVNTHGVDIQVRRNVQR